MIIGRQQRQRRESSVLETMLPFLVVVVVTLQHTQSFSAVPFQRSLYSSFQNDIHQYHQQREETIGSWSSSTSTSTAAYMNVGDETEQQLRPQMSSSKSSDNDDDDDDDHDVINNNGNNLEYSFYDEATILVRAGSGGQGASTYKKGMGGQNGRPDGGNGGTGGDVILVVDDSLNTLAGLSLYAYKVNSFGGSGAAATANNRRQQQQQSQSQQLRHKSFRAEIGCDGGRQLKSGRYGSDITIRVPPGTIVHELVENEYGDEDLVELGTLLLPENSETDGDDDANDTAVITRRARSSASSYLPSTTSLVVVRGGEGGEGSGINQKGRGLQRPRLPPKGGEKRKLRLTLKLVADIALVGVPNAGKSTFLSKVTRAKPRIADYPFTTVIPNLGVWVPPELFTGGVSSGGTGGNGLVLCDVPGLIEGASRGIGLGHAFLRHVERCSIILHLVDATSSDPLRDFKMLNGELIKYGTGQLARMPQVVVINKIDTFNDYENNSDCNSNNGKNNKLSLEELEVQLKNAMSHSRLMKMSAKEEEGVDELMKRLAVFVKKVI